MKKNGKPPTHLGRYVEDKLLNDIGVSSIREAARCMQIPAATLDNFIQQRCNLSGKVAIRLERVFGLNAKELLLMQDDFVLATEANGSEVSTLKPFDPTTVRSAKGKHPRAIPA